jgi:hypothetical protein
MIFKINFKRWSTVKPIVPRYLMKKVNLGTKDNPQCINLGVGCFEQEKVAFIKLFKEFKYVFAWTYDDLKTFDPNIIQHVIPMKPQTLPFQQKLRKMHPKLEPTIQKELNKILNAKIFFQLGTLNGFLTLSQSGRKVGKSDSASIYETLIERLIKTTIMSQPWNKSFNRYLVLRGYLY